MPPSSVQSSNALVPHGQKCASSKAALTILRIGARTMRAGIGIVILVACCLTCISCAGVSGSKPPHKNSSATSNISGTISPAQGGITLWLSGAASATVTTDGSGNYIFRALADGIYTISASKPGFSFNPGSQDVTLQGSNATGVNFTAAPSSQLPTLSGTINPATNGSGATVTLSGAISSTTIADASGNYSFMGLSDGSYTVTASKSGFNFSPASQSTTINAVDTTGVNFNIYSQASGVNVYPGTDIPSLVNSSPAGTAFVIQPGTYRLTKPIIPKNGDSFIGQTACAPPATSCPAIIKGSRVIGSLATFDGTNYKVTNQTQKNPTGPTASCDPGWSGCIYPEDLFFDGEPYQHLSSSTRPTIGPKQWWFDYSNQVIYFHDNPAGHLVETSVVNNAFGGPANNVTIQYLTVEQFAPMYPTGTISVSQGSNAQTQGTNWTVENCEVLLNHGYGVRVAYGTHILNNYIHNNGQVGVGGGIGVTSAPSTESINSGILIQGNLITDNDYAHFDPNFGSGGIKIGATSGVTIRGNTIQHNEGSGVHFDDFSQNDLLDGNTITDNFDSDGVNQEKGYGTSIFRNNIVLRNGAQVYHSHATDQIAVHASTGVDAYCNVMEVSPGTGINGWSMGAANRGYSSYPGYQYLVATGNSFHHNTVIWDAGARGGTGYIQDDAANQPNFFADNTPPDYNTYHLPNTSTTQFNYDNNNSQNNTPLSFANYQAAGADVHGTADTNYSSGFPTVAITSPVDQSSFTSTATVAAIASDPGGISKVEFYVDWTLQSTATSEPYNFTLTSGTPGSHTLAAMAYNNAGIRACYAVTVNEQ